MSKPILNCDGLDKTNVAEYNLAINIKNYLVAGNRVIGDPGEGLKQTLAALELKRDSRVFGVTDWKTKDPELEDQIAKTKAGIKGEEDLCDYLATLIKYDDKLDGLVAFASLAYNFGEENNLDYIPDTDTLLVYGSHILVVDAKNLKTKPGNPLMLVENSVVDAEKMKELITVHPSTHIWEKVMADAGIPLLSIDGYVCIVNDLETEIIRDQSWYESNTKLIHISELKDILEEWVEGKENKLSLKMLTEIGKAQIKKEKESTIDTDKIKRQFNI